jgi:hypothetical protein
VYRSLRSDITKLKNILQKGYKPHQPKMNAITTLQNTVNEIDRSINEQEEAINRLLLSQYHLRNQKRQVLRQLFDVKWPRQSFDNVIVAFYNDCVDKYPRENRTRLKYYMKIFDYDGQMTIVYITKKNIDVTIPEIVQDAYRCAGLPVPTVLTIDREKDAMAQHLLSSETPQH